MKAIALELKWALIFVVAGLGWMVLERITGLHSTRIALHPVLTNLFIIPAVYLYWLAMKERKKTFGGTITFGQAFKSGLVITLFVTLLTPLSQYITHTIITPHYFENVINYAVKEQRMTIDDAKAYFNMKNYIIQSALFAPVAGLITSLVVSWLISRKSKSSN